MATPIVNYVRARIAFMPIMIADNEADPADLDKVRLWLTLLPEGQRVLTEAADEAERVPMEPSYRAATDDVPKGWTGVVLSSDADALLVARSYQIGGMIEEGDSSIPFPTPIVTIKEL
jgi:hypothetical protein